MSPTELSLKQLRNDGWQCAVVERWNSHARIRQDLFGGIDIVACRPRQLHGFFSVAGGVWGIQVCSDNGGSMAAHRTKLLAEPRIATWLASGGGMELWAWSTRRSLERTKAGKRSKRLVHHLRREEIRLEHFIPQNQPETGRHAEVPGHDLAGT